MDPYRFGFDGIWLCGRAAFISPWHAAEISNHRKIKNLFAAAKVDAFSRQPDNPNENRARLLVINNIDLAPLVGANLGVMEADTLRMRRKRPFVFSNLKSGEGVEPIANFIIEKGGLAKKAA